MAETEILNIFFERLAKILIRSFFLGVAILLLWYFSLLIGSHWIYQINASWFDIDQTAFNLVNYVGMGFAKITIILFFLFPYLAIKWVLRKEKKHT